MTDDELDALADQAHRLWAVRFYERARDTFEVLGDAYEERGDIEEAEVQRRWALRAHVAAWAYARWPKEFGSIDQVRFATIPFGPFGGLGGRRRIAMHILQRAWRLEGPEAAPPMRITVGRRGDIRVEHDGWHA